MGDFRVGGAIAAVPVCFISALLFGSFGLWMAALSRTIESLSYPQYLVIFPMFLFCGIYFPLSTLPKFLQDLAWVFPLTSVVSVIRALTLGTPFFLRTIPILAVWLGIFVYFSRKTMTTRLIK